MSAMLRGLNAASPQLLIRSSSRLSKLIDLPQLCQDLIDHRAAVTGMLPVVKERFYFISGEMCTHLWIAQNGLLESTARAIRGHGGFVNNGVGASPAHPRRHRQHHGFGEPKTPACLPVIRHAVGVQ